MALLDSIIGGLLGGGQQSSPMASVLSGLLGGGGASGGLGGLSGIIGRMEQAGLGNVAQSWVGNGPNQSVSPQELQRVFRPEELNQMSQQSGVPQGDLLGQLAQFLPHAVDRMTPNGHLQDVNNPFAGGGQPESGADPFSGEGTSSVRV